MANDDHVLDDLPAYVLGSLDAADFARVEEHLLSCLICREESDSLQAVAGGLAFAVPQELPPPDLKRRLMEHVPTAHGREHTSQRIAGRPWQERLLPVWGIASLGLIIALAAFSLALWQRLERLEFVTAPGGMRAIPLTAREAAPGAEGFVIVGADGRDGALVVDGLASLGDDQQYQLWLIRDGQWISGAIFSTDEQNYAGTRIRAPGSLLDYQTANITIEPAGGSPEPVGEVVLGGSLFNP